ncbi:MAG TPA: DnaA/Hda family protein [Gemmatimonadales bacterium]
MPSGADVHLDGHLRFGNFVVGSANRLAAAAARAVAEAPGTVYNPLFIYSASGLGKTHLAAAIGWHARERQPGLAVEYATVDELVDRLHVAVSTGQGEALRQRYARVDLLLLDDVQFLTGRRETQSELLRIFNVMQDEGRQIVMTSDRPPAEIADVDERLVSRLSGGLIVDIGAPDFETKVAILRSKCAERELHLDADVLEEVARLDFASVRELQGALNRLAAIAALDRSEVHAANVPRLLGVRPPTPRVTETVVDGEYLSFVADVAAAVATSVEEWKTVIGEAITRWQERGYRTAVLERAVALPRRPDVDGLLATYEAAAAHLAMLEEEVAAFDASLRGLAVFRDPEGIAAAEAFVDRVRAAGAPLPHPSADFPRERYVVSASNQLAVRAADSVAAEPGRRFNPLFLHGPSGVGKTHLMHAIGLALQSAAGGGPLVACVSAPQFVDELIAALQAGTVEAWRARYRAADALLIDDVHFVAGRERTQEELFHIFNALVNQGKQIVFTSDRPPRELEGLADRLRTRFEGGLVAALHPPDRALRGELYARAFAHAETTVATEVISYLADRPAASAREIQGTANRLLAAAEMAGVPLSVSFVRSELDGSVAAGAPPAHVSGVTDPFFLDDEKVVWDWPDVGGRAIEELR